MIKLTVLFEDPFWIGVFEKSENGKIEICRIVFGQEPKDYEVYEFVLKNYYNLKFSKPLLIDEKPEAKVNPKRMQRKIKKTIQKNDIGTKAQQAMKLDYENKKSERKLLWKEKREMQEELKFQKRYEYLAQNKG
ncbi:YjdF family protein [Clostridium sp. DJ247]|uniref:YjdF family protein n=1 Tax=Clostridium sp. DJ247 TaxID=2726188 RepID=UPI0016255634|nr:YjdF family protein [Clostridium sp. DJ247]MBC2579195.1 YjdF family protein [Clostridium sp. DJ247]